MAKSGDQYYVVTLPEMRWGITASSAWEAIGQAMELAIEEAPKRLTDLSCYRRVTRAKYCTQPNVICIDDDDDEEQ